MRTDRLNEKTQKQMNKKTKYGIIILAVLFFSSPLLAQNPQGSVHVNGGLSWFLKENIDSGFETGFGFSFPLFHKNSLVFNFGYWKSSVHKEADGLYSGTLSMAPFQASLYYHILEIKGFIPYVFGGAGMIFTHFKMEDLVTIPEVSIDQKVNNGVSFHAGAGSHLKINKHLALYSEICFLYRKAEGTTTITDMNKGVSIEKFPLNLNSFALRFGIRYYL
jgi:hypothetical protein